MAGKISEDPVATDLVGAVVPIVQDGVNKKADASLFGGGSIGGSTGSTDNALLRADGTGGATLQGSIVSVSDGGTMTGLVELLIGLATPLSVMNEVGPGSTLQPGFQLHGSGTVGMLMARWSANNVGPRAAFVKSRGAVGTNGVVSSGDMIGMFVFDGDDGAAFPTAAAFGAYVDGTPGSSDMPGRLVFLTTPDGAVTPAERLRIDSAGVISHRANATVVVDANSHLGLRSYTVATLPSASTAGRLIYVSDGASSKRLAVSDGSAWRYPDGATV